MSTNNIEYTIAPHYARKAWLEYGFKLLGTRDEGLSVAPCLRPVGDDDAWETALSHEVSHSRRNWEWVSPLTHKGVVNRANWNEIRAITNGIDQRTADYVLASLFVILWWAEGGCNWAKKEYPKGGTERPLVLSSYEGKRAYEGRTAQEVVEISLSEVNQGEDDPLPLFVCEALQTLENYLGSTYYHLINQDKAQIVQAMQRICEIAEPVVLICDSQSLFEWTEKLKDTVTPVEIVVNSSRVIADKGREVEAFQSQTRMLAKELVEVNKKAANSRSAAVVFMVLWAAVLAVYLVQLFSR